jgi:hypothetical protein
MAHSDQIIHCDESLDKANLKICHMFAIKHWCVSATLTQMSGHNLILGVPAIVNPFYLIDHRIDLNVFYFTVENTETGEDRGVSRNSGKPIQEAVSIFKEIIRFVESLFATGGVNSLYFSGLARDNRTKLYDRIANLLTPHALVHGFIRVDVDKLFRNGNPKEQFIFLKRGYFMSPDVAEEYSFKQIPNT